jgi:hypothetical protein
VKDTARLAELDRDQEQRDLLHPLRKTGRFNLPAQG